ncbi:adenylyltransferase [Alkaliphilus metalliredigens QYMF]|uniref:Adenylyltransferase n=1 Tax=Alkaliphilus metalliredigens (strain QYMF) TaxID=293826 RepID=A6TTG7_ALKMQ|nr:aminoglycoside 6-adenylyltransferase [Alkaliphilus metalliredigens]ABR49485.1 adenylyltransferase [Alkaliphilus metalliredigens QYMF]
MRTEKEMMDRILNTAKEDERIRAVVMNGSRVGNPSSKDCFQDYDIVYFVNDFEYFACNHSWIDIFGERIMLEMPSYKDYEVSDYNGRFNYQILFKDGNRIDLTFASIENIDTVIENDRVGITLLDKDGLLQSIVFSGVEVYFVSKPTKRAFENSCNSFWWILQNVAKGIKRRELPYAIKMLNIARNDLDTVASWYIGMKHDFKVLTGKMGKYLERYLDENLWNLYKDTFPTGNYEDIWKSLFCACKLYRLLATEIADQFSYCYPYDDDKLMSEYLQHVKNLPDNPDETHYQNIYNL